MNGILDLTYKGNNLGVSAHSMGELRSANDVLHDREELWERIAEDGYLFLRGFLNVDEVKAARQEVMDRLWNAGVLDKDYPAYEGVWVRGAEFDGRSVGGLLPRLALNNAPLDKVIYDGAMMDFYRFFLGGPVRHFDFTWFRHKRPGVSEATHPHYDIVFMGRGTKNLFTSWTPFVDIPYEMGGLMLLEGSHKQEELKATYGSTDVDLYCSNVGGAESIIAGARKEGRDLTEGENESIRWDSTGAYSHDALAVRDELGSRWLTTEYKMGDLLIFPMYMMHSSSDNRSDRVRISTDTRYQLASEAVDERWIGDNPSAHGIRSKKGMIC